MFNIFRGPIELLMGVVFGGLVGVLCWFLPNKTEVNIHMDTMCMHTKLQYTLFAFCKI